MALTQTTTHVAFPESPAKLVRHLRNNIVFRIFNTGDNASSMVLQIGGKAIRLDTANTVINCDSPINTDKFLAEMKRMSTPAIGYLINALVGRMNASHAYLNIGVFRGFTFFSGLVGNTDKRCIGVDNFSQFGGPRDEFLAGYERYKSANSAFHDMDYVEYLTAKHMEPIGLYYFDGPHEYDDQFRALELAERFFAPDALIFVDDTNSEAPRQATLNFMAARPGRYELLLDEKTFGNGHPTFWNGLMILGPAEKAV